MQMFSLDKNEMLVLNVVREERSILWGAGLWSSCRSDFHISWAKAEISKFALQQLQNKDLVSSIFLHFILWGAWIFRVNLIQIYLLRKLVKGQFISEDWKLCPDSGARRKVVMFHPLGNMNVHSHFNPPVRINVSVVFLQTRHVLKTVSCCDNAVLKVWLGSGTKKNTLSGLKTETDHVST